MPKPRVVLIGAEFEENLSLRYLASAVAETGFDSILVPFNDAAAAPGIVDRVLSLHPAVVGISVPFQSRAGELLGLADRLRAGGCDAHITVGGHFVTFEYANVLRDFPAIEFGRSPRGRRRRHGAMPPGPRRRSRGGDTRHGSPARRRHRGWR